MPSTLADKPAPLAPAPDMGGAFQHRTRLFDRRRTTRGVARTCVAETLVQWGRTERLDDVQLCVSGLAANAIPHGAPAGGLVLVRVTLDDLQLRIEVQTGATPHPADDPYRPAPPAVAAYCSSRPSPTTEAWRNARAPASVCGPCAPCKATMVCDGGVVCGGQFGHVRRQLRRVGGRGGRKDGRALESFGQPPKCGAAPWGIWCTTGLKASCPDHL